MAAYHPQSNGMVERFHRQLKASLTVRLTGPNWASQLPWVLLGIRAAHKDNIGTSPAELVYGTELSLPGQFRAPMAGNPAVGPFLDDLRRAMAELRPTPTAHLQPTDPHLTNIPKTYAPAPWYSSAGTDTVPHCRPGTTDLTGPWSRKTSTSVSSSGTERTR